MTVEALYSVTSVAAQLDCSRGHVYDLINAGRIRTVSIGLGRSKTRVSESALKTYLRTLGVGTEPPAGPQQPPNPTHPPRTRAMTDPDPMPLPPGPGYPDPASRPAKVRAA
ncbi:MAG TPA: helix-turn-helix domain-containing protein [Micromonosporaceae bacterium]